MTTASIPIHTRTRPAEAYLAAAFTAFALGTLMIFAVGFARSETLHNAAHDTRHAIGFPCH